MSPSSLAPSIPLPGNDRRPHFEASDSQPNSFYNELQVSQSSDRGSPMDEASRQASTVFSALETAWKNGDGDAFAEQFTPDADFVNIIGMHAQGKAAIAELHAQIFNTIYAGSIVSFPIKSVRLIGEGVAVAVTLPEVQAPSGPFKGTIQTVATATLVRAGDAWRIAAFHNTRRDAPPAGTAERMRSEIGKL
jgi:uncharacterized protein (TIGR02246 family)